MTTNDYDDRSSPGFWANLFNSFRIAWKLLWDDRVPLSTKIIPVLTIMYVLSPIDLVPGFMLPILGQLDDVAILLVGTRLFIAMSPKDIVERLRAEIEGRPPRGEWTVTGSRPQNSDQSRSSASDEIIDG